MKRVVIVTGAGGGLGRAYALDLAARGLRGLHGLSAYAASKAALIGLMRSLAAEGRSRDVLCNAVAPYAATRMTSSHDDETFRDAMRPEYVAPIVAVLVSERGTINGQTIVAGGGRFRRAATVEGLGLIYDDAARVTPEMLEQDMEALLRVDGAHEFADAMTAFNDFSARVAK